MIAFTTLLLWAYWVMPISIEALLYAEYPPLLQTPYNNLSSSAETKLKIAMPENRVKREVNSRYNSVNNQESGLPYVSGPSEMMEHSIPSNRGSHYENQNHSHKLPETLPYYDDHDMIWFPCNGTALSYVDVLTKLHSTWDIVENEDFVESYNKTTYETHPTINSSKAYLNCTGVTYQFSTMMNISFLYSPDQFIDTSNKRNVNVHLHYHLPNTSQTMIYEYPPWENLTSEQQTLFLAAELGDPQKYNTLVTNILSAYYGTLLSVGIPGNGLTCLIILTNNYMRTASNLFLLNLALVDIITLTLGKNMFY